MGQSCISESDKAIVPLKKHKKEQSVDNDLEFRDREFIFSLYKNSQSVQTYSLEEWATEVLSKLFSTSFYYIEENKLTYKEVRYFLCSNVLKNIISCSQQQNITFNDIKNLNEFMSKKLLPYILAKYPMSSQSEVNVKFMKKIKDIDNLQESENDYIAKSQIIFEYRETQNYNDLIMKFLNQIIELPDLRNSKIQIIDGKQVFSAQKESYFNIFKNYMTEIFTSCYDHNKVHQNDQTKKTLTTQEQENYQKEVKAYTSFLIGRKISNNCKVYTEDQIKNKDMSIKNPAILRILTKWSEQLQNKYNNPMMFVDRVQPYNYIDKRPGFALPRADRLQLYKLVQQQKIIIEKKLKKIVQQIYQHQASVLKQSNYRSVKFIPQLEFKSAFFADACIKALDSFVIKYLNILIHGLKNISKKYHQIDKKLTAPYQLLTFRVGDLMRCKCHSRQKEILFLYDKIMSCDPKILKVIRIKNRLSGGTQDILMNLKFYDKFTIQIQLGIDSTKNKYIELCTKFNHFVYELERAQFGPIMQMCSIWQSQNVRLKKIHQAIKTSSKCSKQDRKLQNFCKTSHKFQIQINPLLCSQCFDIYANDQNLLQNQKCIDCPFKICSFCRIKNLNDKDLKQIIFKNQQVRKNSKRCYQTQINKLPQCALIFNKNSKNKRLTAYKKFKDQLGKDLFIQKQRDENYKILNLNEKNIQNYLIWQNPISQNYFEGVTNQKIKKQCILPNMFKQNQKKDKNNVQFQNHNMTEAQFQQLSQKLWDKDYKNKIQTMNLSANNIRSMLRILKQIPNTEFLVLDQNKTTKIQIPKISTRLSKLSMTRIKFENNKNQIIIDSFSDYSSLKYLNIGWSKLKQLPQQLCLLKNLQQLSAQTNKLTKIFSSINKLQKLKILALNGNQISDICSGVWQLSQLQQLQMKSNKLNKISSDIKSLKNLKKLRVDKNSLKELPQEIGQLKNLIQISASENQIVRLPKSLSKLKNLQFLMVNSNQLTGAQEVEDLQSLQKLCLDKNKITKFTKLQKLQKLKILQFQQNQLKSIEKDILKSKSLQQLNLSKNSLTNLNPSIKFLSSLKKMNLANNKLQFLCDEISGIHSLQQLNLQGNQLKALPNTFNHFLNLVKLSIDTFYFEPESKQKYQSLLKRLESKGVKIQRIHVESSTITSINLK